MSADLPPPGTDLGPKHPDYQRLATLDKEALTRRWSADGAAIRERLIQASFSRKALNDSIGKICGKYDLRAISLEGVVLRQVDLSNCDLFSADLSKADLWNADLRDAYLSEAVVKGANLSWVKVRGTLVDNMSFDRRTKLLGIDLSGINTNFALELMAEIRDQQRIYDLNRRHPVFARLLAITSDYGRSLSRWSICTLAVLLAFGAVFASCPQHFHGIAGVADGMYFSVVTFTTLGLGSPARQSGTRPP